jgi:hypothetical protein
MFFVQLPEAEKYGFFSVVGSVIYFGWVSLPLFVTKIDTIKKWLDPAQANDVNTL